MNLVDLLVVFVCGLSVYALAARGLALGLFDMLRVVLGLGLGLAANSIAYRLTHSFIGGILAFITTALVFVLLLAWLLRRSSINPSWGRQPLARVMAGGLGLLLGAALLVFLLPALGRGSALEGDILDSRLARPFVRLAPAIYDLADRWNIEIPQLSRRAIAFEDEGKVGQDIFADRIRYSKLSGATCIECGSPVEFLGYRLRQGLAVSPLFRCPVCGRTSDGCQTFEGFHRMYYHCPYEVARGRVAIDCGVWPNRRPVQPKGKCPVCGREGK